MKKFVGIFAGVLLCSVAFAIDVNQDELKVGQGDSVQFENYGGPHAKIDSAAAIVGIGTNLGKEVAFVEKPVEMPLTDDMDKIILSPTDDMGPNRQDRKVTLTVEGEEKRTSNILLGYNKQGFELEDGEYLL